MPTKHKMSFRAGLVFHSILLVFGVPAVSAQASPDREIKGLPATLAIAQFIDGRFLLVGLKGTVHQFDLRPDNFYTLARFSADGKLVVGLTERTITVLNQRLERVWQRNTGVRNITDLALSPDGTKVAFLESDLRSRTVHLEITAAEGPNEIVETVASGEAAQAQGLSWGPRGERITFAAGSEIRIVDVNRKTSITAAAGYDPSWSPDGQWIAYRSTEARLMLLDVRTRTPQQIGLRLHSGVHWSPDSNYVFIDEYYSVRRSVADCIRNSRFVVYRLSDKARKVVYDPCGLRDSNFGWVSDAAEWARAAAAKSSATGRRDSDDKK